MTFKLICVQLLFSTFNKGFKVSVKFDLQKNGDIYWDIEPPYQTLTNWVSHRQRVYGNIFCIILMIITSITKYFGLLDAYVALVTYMLRFDFISGLLLYIMTYTFNYFICAMQRIKDRTFHINQCSKPLVSTIYSTLIINLIDGFGCSYRMFIHE